MCALPVDSVTPPRLAWALARPDASGTMKYHLPTRPLVPVEGPDVLVYIFVIGFVRCSFLFLAIQTRYNGFVTRIFVITSPRNRSSTGWSSFAHGTGTTIPIPPRLPGIH